MNKQWTIGSFLSHWDWGLLNTAAYSSLSGLIQLACYPSPRWEPLAEKAEVLGLLSMLMEVKETWGLSDGQPRDWLPT